MRNNKQGSTFYELLIVLILIVVMVSLGHSVLAGFFMQEKSQAFNSSLKRSLLLAKKYAWRLPETIAFCVGHNKQCFAKPLTEALIYTDDYHDGKLHDKKQIKRVVMLPTVSGDLLFRTFPSYRNILLFHAQDGLKSDNGTFWYCPTKQGKPRFGIAINRLAMIHDLIPNKQGD